MVGAVGSADFALKYGLGWNLGQVGAGIPSPGQTVRLLGAQAEYPARVTIFSSHTAKR